MSLSISAVFHMTKQYIVRNNKNDYYLKKSKHAELLIDYEHGHAYDHKDPKN